MTQHKGPADLREKPEILALRNKAAADLTHALRNFAGLPAAIDTDGEYVVVSLLPNQAQKLVDKMAATKSARVEK